MDASGGKLTGEVSGEVESEDGVLVLKRIHAAYSLEAGEEQRETVERVHGMHKEYCPVYRSICAAIEVTTSVDLR